MVESMIVSVPPFADAAAETAPRLSVDGGADHRRHCRR